MNKTYQYKCQSYYDDNNVLQDCSCGKCDQPSVLCPRCLKHPKGSTHTCKKSLQVPDTTHPIKTKADQEALLKLIEGKPDTTDKGMREQSSNVEVGDDLRKVVKSAEQVVEYLPVEYHNRQVSKKLEPADKVEKPEYPCMGCEKMNWKFDGRSWICDECKVVENPDNNGERSMNKTEALQAFLNKYDVSLKWDKSGATSIIVMAFEQGWEAAKVDPKAKALGEAIMRVQELSLANAK